MLNKRKTYRFISLSLSLLMFITSMGYSVDIHYCQDEIQSISLLGKAKSCHDMDKHHCESNQDVQNQSCHSSNDASSCEKDCCHNEKLNQDNFKKEALNSTVDITEIFYPQFLFAFVNMFLLDNSSFFNSVDLFEHYTPPLVERDIQSLFQIFLN